MTRFGVGVFGFQVGGDFGVLLVAQPGVIVHQRDAVNGGFFMVLARDGGLELDGLGFDHVVIILAAGFELLAG